MAQSAESTPAPVKRRLAWALICPILLASAFPLLMRVRDARFVTPNEPVIQLGWTKHLIDQTRFALGFDGVETVGCRPNAPATACRPPNSCCVISLSKWKSSTRPPTKAGKP